MKEISSAVSPLLLLAFVVFSSNAALGQKSVSFKELYALKTEARKTLDTRPRRVVVQIQDYRDPNAAKSELTVYEYLAEDRTRYHRKLEIGKTRTEFESIVVGEFQYTRENNGNWRANETGLPISGPTSIADSEAGSCQVRELTVRLTYLDALPAYHYAETAFENGKTGIVQVERGTWIGLDGSILKETEDRKLYSGGAMRNLWNNSESYHSSISYEYDPRIKIEAPIN